MKFLLDVNASGIVAEWLESRGHDVAKVADNDASMQDDPILKWAVEEQRIIVTTDQDFEEMIWRTGRRHCGVLRLENVPRSERQVLLQDALAHHGQDLLSGCVVIALTRKTRGRQPSWSGTTTDEGHGR